MKAIYKKELLCFFATLPGYIFITFILVVIGAYCILFNFISAYSSFEYVIDYIALFYVFIIPILTMRVFSEERRQKTDQLLYSLPLDSWEIVLGKYFALVTVSGIPAFVMSIYPLVLTFYGKVDLKTAYSSIAAFFFLGCLLCAIGMFISALTENQLIGAVITLGVLFLLYRISGFAAGLSTSAPTSFRALTLIFILFGLIILIMTKNVIIAAIPFAVLELSLIILYQIDLMLVAGKINLIVNNVGIFDKITTFTGGVFDFTAIVFYLTVSALLVIFTIEALDKRRWS